MHHYWIEESRILIFRSNTWLVRLEVSLSLKNWQKLKGDFEQKSNYPARTC